MWEMDIVRGVFGVLLLAARLVLKLTFGLVEFLFGGSTGPHPQVTAALPANVAPVAQPADAGPPLPLWRHLVILGVVVGVVALTFSVAMAVAPRDPFQAATAKPAAATVAKKKAPVRAVKRAPPSSDTASAGR